jgi:hypothetical protein
VIAAFGWFRPRVCSIRHLSAHHDVALSSRLVPFRECTAPTSPLLPAHHHTASYILQAALLFFVYSDGKSPPTSLAPACSWTASQMTRQASHPRRLPSPVPTSSRRQTSEATSSPSRRATSPATSRSSRWHASAPLVLASYFPHCCVRLLYPFGKHVAS